MNKKLNEQIRELAERDFKNFKAKEERDKHRNKGELLSIVIQAFYGNRMGTEVYEDEVDSRILGHTSLPLKFPDDNEKVDRTIINLPCGDNLVMIYNKYQEDRALKRKEEVFVKKNYVIKPLATIPELGIELYSRCAVCRINGEGRLLSLKDGDYETVIKYLAE